MKIHKHIFIIEDDELYSMMLDYILSKDSVYQFVSFKSGEECIKNLYLNPDIIILDYGLPGINGYKTLLKIKAYNPKIHAIVLGNNTDPELAPKLLEAGADDFVLKQGHGEAQIIEKKEKLLNIDELKKKKHQRTERKSAFAKMFGVHFDSHYSILGTYFPEIEN